MKHRLDLSVILGTLNRLPFLKLALSSIAAAVGSRDSDLRYEIIVVDGGSRDGTQEWLRVPKIFPEGKAPEVLRPIFQKKRTGAVEAFNFGFGTARGEYVAAFNDDAEYRGQALAAAIGMLRQDPSIGQIAIPFLTQKVERVEQIASSPPGPPQVAMLNLPGFGKVPYANFGVISRALGERLGWWEDYYQYAGDTHLSAGVWHYGLRVVGLPPQHGYIVHYEAQDETRLPNVETVHFNALWRGDSRKMPATVSQSYVAPVGSKPLPRPNASVPKGAVTALRYRGNRQGGHAFQRPGSVSKYVVSVKDSEFEADQRDVQWLLSLREGGRILFEQIQ